MTDSAKVLVTGASGYIASHVVQQLQEAGHVVRGTVRSLKNEEKVKHLHELCPNAAHKLELVEADLTNPESWLPAVEGMTHVMHVASPLPVKGVRHEDEVIKPAVEGTLSVLRACAKSHTVKRVVFTSAGVVVDWSQTSSERPLTEDNWADVSKLEGYAKSKFLAERAAWDFMKELPDEEKFELSVIIPCGVLGPPLHNTLSASLQIVQKVLARDMPVLPKLNLPLVDVRDVALAHVRAMTLPEAAGNRFICCAGNMWMSELAALLKCVFEPQGYSIPTMICPNFLVRFASLFDTSLKFITPHLGLVHLLDNTRMREVLKIEPRNLRDTVIETAHSLIEKGLVKRSGQYRGPGGEEERQTYLDLQL